MPIYDYYCEACERVEENVFQKFDDPPLKCKGKFGEPGKAEDVAHAECDMIRLIGNVAFQKIGKGWPDQDNKELKERFERRNKRIEKMTPEQQEVIKKIIDKPGSHGKRYIP